MSSTPLTPSLVCIGPHNYTEEHLIPHLQKMLCPDFAASGACRCKTCRLIIERRSPYVTWIEPTNDYILEDLAPLFATVHYRLEEGAHHFFVLTQAERLSTVCANRLLKTLEEPPAGYHFIFLTQNYETLLPTVQSRCSLLFRAPEETTATHALILYFTDPDKRTDPMGFDSFLKSESFSPGDARLAVQQLAINVQQYNYKSPELIEEILEKAQRNFPQAGGTQHYLRWLFMMIHASEHREEQS